MQIWRPANYTVQQNTRLDVETAAWLKTKAEAERLSPAGFVRRLLKEAARLDLQPSGVTEDD